MNKILFNLHISKCNLLSILSASMTQKLFKDRIQLLLPQTQHEHNPRIQKLDLISFRQPYFRLLGQAAGSDTESRY